MATESQWVKRGLTHPDNLIKNIRFAFEFVCQGDMSSNSNEKYSEEIKEVVVDRGTYELILHNDDYHTFDFVIDTLMSGCGHTQEQAEQCAWIVHNNGKCQIKRGSYPKLRPIYTTINRSGLLVELKKESKKN